jgi:hypothetical protein
VDPGGEVVTGGLTTRGLVELVDSEPALAIIFQAENDDLWWGEVLRYALDEGEYKIGLVDAADLWPDIFLREDKATYDGAAVAAWLGARVKQPRWQWHRWVEIPEHDRDDEERTHALQSQNGQPADGHWHRGAIVEVTG